jgi:two-component system chemotaxis response regulator CheY
MVVDDSAFARRMMRRALEEAGHTVFEADGGAAALAQYPTTRPDIVTLDLLMPGMEGAEVLQRLLELDPEARVIVCSSNVQTVVKSRLLALGARGYLTKPPAREALLQALAAATEPPSHA